MSYVKYVLSGMAGYYMALNNVPFLTALTSFMVVIGLVYLVTLWRKKPDYGTDLNMS